MPLIKKKVNSTVDNITLANNKTIMILFILELNQSNVIVTKFPVKIFSCKCQNTHAKRI